MPLTLLAPVAVAAAAQPALPRPADILAATRRVADWQLAHRTTFDHMPAARASVRNPRDWQQATFWVALTELADRDRRYRRAVARSRPRGAVAARRQPVPRRRPADRAELGMGGAQRRGRGGAGAGARLFRQCPRQAADRQPGVRARSAPGRAIVGVHRSLVLVRRAVHGAADAAASWARRPAIRATPPSRTPNSARRPTICSTRASACSFRDSRFFERRDDAGRKLFWSRGNGWVMAGLVAHRSRR